MPRVKSMIKNRIAQSRGRGMRSTASGYVMKARPGPDETTSFTDTPLSLARKPSIANTTKPANIAVSMFVTDTKNASLQAHVGIKLQYADQLFV
jgi:hypothetical protein